MEFAVDILDKLLPAHRVMCGDSTKQEDVEKLMNGAKAHLIVTDPPYNVTYTGKTKKALTIRNDSMGNDEFYQFLFDVYTNLLAVAEDGAGIYVFHADTEGVNFRKALVDAGFKLSQCCVWVMFSSKTESPWPRETCSSNPTSLRPIAASQGRGAIGFIGVRSPDRLRNG